MWHIWHNSLTSGESGNNFKSIIFKLIIQNSGLGICCEIALKWMPQKPANEKKTLFQVVAWCHQTSQYLSQCLPISMSEVFYRVPAMFMSSYTVKCHYNKVYFLQNNHKRHRIAHPSIVDSASGWYAVSVTAMMSALSTEKLMITPNKHIWSQCCRIFMLFYCEVTRPTKRMLYWALKSNVIQPI